MISSAQEFVDYWEGVRERTRRVVLLIPRDRFEWSPGPGRWTFGDIVRHLAGIERDMHAENVMGRPSRSPGHGRELADGFEAALAYLDRKHREAVRIFSGLEPDRLQARCLTPAGIEITTWKWLRAMVEHEAHHRGQLYLMLGMLGVQPPQLYGLSEEEVKARSS
ncbi:MAG: DinB family protein [Gemmatimonadales bacterium]